MIRNFQLNTRITGNQFCIYSCILSAIDNKKYKSLFKSYKDKNNSVFHVKYTAYTKTTIILNLRWPGWPKKITKEAYFHNVPLEFKEKKSKKSKLKCN